MHVSVYKEISLWLFQLKYCTDKLLFQESFSRVYIVSLNYFFLTLWLFTVKTFDEMKNKK